MIPVESLRALAWLIWASLALSGMMACSPAPNGQEQALQALRRLEARTNRMVWHENYAEDLAKAQAAMRNFLGSQASRQNSRAAAHLEAALFDYELANKIWELLRKAGQSSVAGSINNVCIRRSSALGQLLGSYLPTLKVSPEETRGPCPNDEIEITRQIAVIWGHASQELKLAAQLMGK